MDPLQSHHLHSGSQKWQQWTPEMDRTLWWSSDSGAISRSCHSLAHISQPSTSNKCFQNNQHLFNMEPGTLEDSEPCNLWLLFSYCLPVVSTPSYKKFAILTEFLCKYTVFFQMKITFPLVDNKPLLRSTWERKMVISALSRCVALLMSTSLGSSSLIVKWHMDSTWSLCSLPAQNSVWKELKSPIFQWGYQVIKKYILFLGFRLFDSVLYSTFSLQLKLNYSSTENLNTWGLYGSLNLWHSTSSLSEVLSKSWR